ncbi:hypothetical protein VNO78_15207 [Psophocarpus tetragonolobus]|uniref:Uncharacterized protein n=1 Tax=Psophocarpus tetragonolobus TaxID=3891 RepID=A0AAN9SEL2_PSOTE
MYRLQSSCQAYSVDLLFNAVDRFSCSEFHAATLYKFYKYLSHLVKTQCLKFSAKTFLYAVYCAYIEIFFNSKPTIEFVLQKLKRKNLNCEFWCQQKHVNLCYFAGVFDAFADSSVCYQYAYTVLWYHHFEKRVLLS